MKNQALLRGIVLIAIAIFFGGQAMTYDIGTFANAGPGLFPLVVSSIVCLIGAITVFRATTQDGKKFSFRIKNITLIMLSLVGLPSLL